MGRASNWGLELSKDVPLPIATVHKQHTISCMGVLNFISVYSIYPIEYIIL